MSSPEAKISLQRNRMDYIIRLAEELPVIKREKRKQVILTKLNLLESYWSKFETTHERLCELKTEGLLELDYFKSSYLDHCIDQYAICSAELLTLRDEIDAADPLSGHSLADISHSQAFQSSGGSFPKHQLTTFSGDYQQWRPFHDLFVSMVGSHPELSTVEKMHYLKSSLTGEAAQLISNLPVSGESSSLAWDQLVDRYENKRILITTQLDKLFSALPVTSKSSKSLNTLLCTTSEALNSLKTLGAPVDQWDWILVRLMSRNLDSASREAWELHLGSSTDYPSLAQLKVFLTGRARALETIEIERSRPPLKFTTNPTARAHAATQACDAPPRPPQRFDEPSTPACDDCGGNHYIAACPQFRDRSHAARDKLVVYRWLCFNCLGRHNLRSCRNKTTCRVCQGRHHSLLHRPDSSPTAPAQRTPRGVDKSQDCPPTPEPQTSQTVSFCGRTPAPTSLPPDSGTSSDSNDPQ